MISIPFFLLYFLPVLLASFPSSLSPSILPPSLPPFVYSSVFLYCGSSIIKQHLTFIPSYLQRLSRHELLISINTQTHRHTPSSLPIRPAEKTVNIDSPFSFFFFAIVKLCSSTQRFLFVCVTEASKENSERRGRTLTLGANRGGGASRGREAKILLFCGF